MSQLRYLSHPAQEWREEHRQRIVGREPAKETTNKQQAEQADHSDSNDGRRAKVVQCDGAFRHQSGRDSRCHKRRQQGERRDSSLDVTGHHHGQSGAQDRQTESQGNRGSWGTLGQPGKQTPHTSQQRSANSQRHASLPRSPAFGGIAQVSRTVQQDSWDRYGQAHPQQPRDPTRYVRESRDQFDAEGQWDGDR